MAAFVIGRDGYVDEFGGGVCVTESNDGDVDVGGFLDGLGVGAWVCHDDEARFFERACDVIGEVTRREASCDGDGTGVGCEL